jgi:hypothetical protein
MGTKELYELWKEAWQKEKPNNFAPTFEEFMWFAQTFNFTPNDLFGIMEK